MARNSVDMYEIRVPLEAIKRMSDEERYAYYVLGHIFNELMALQKLTAFALPKHDDRRPARLSPELSQALFLFRTAASKIWEAKQTLHNKEVSATLRRTVFPRMGDGPARLKELNAAVKGAPWLARLRNSLGFHYPSFDQWKHATTPADDWVDDSIFLGDRSGNTFYDGPEATARYWMFHQHEPDDVRASIDPMIDEVIRLIGLTTSFLEDALGVFIDEVLMNGRGERKLVGKVLAPEFQRVSIPFWTVLEDST